MNNKNSGFAHLLLVLVIVAAGVGALGYFAFKNGQIKLNNDDAQSTIVVTPTISFTVTPVPTLIEQTEKSFELKTYTNSDFGFSFKYPTKLTQHGSGYTGATYLGNPKLIESFADESTTREGTDASFDGFTVYKLTNSEETPQEFMKLEVAEQIDSPRGMEDTEIKTTKVGAYNVFYIDPSQVMRQYFVFKDSQNIILFSVSRQSAALDDFYEVFTEILSTFKFTM